MKDYLSTEQVCERLGCHPCTLPRWIAMGRFPPAKFLIGRRHYWLASDWPQLYATFLERRTVELPPTAEARSARRPGL
jgi:excisionase family DNA binding protein